ncbi:MBL fold metallo-hydrolase [Chitinophaga sp. XS-30]|uniref:MBL fold metallo-hydrolase n=1 Tax=Chitinophaga sp. XS-30 TaxID=2604421 RepID=UPI0011DD63FD|nr:MBL fold metallo-hydrolase [Chitinophaga sp. XS-30]QEH43226.1 MBL fold metallo-hydrolase [Chitinophaga sp. XS-30]
MKRVKAWQSPNFRDGIFQNQSPTSLMSPDASYFRLLLKFFSKSSTVYPPEPLPAVRTDLKALPAGNPVIVWFGHSSYLIHHNGFNILVDPVFSGYASPFSFLVKAFPGSNIYTVDDLPEIDLLIITHNHYDHLDQQTLRRLQHRVRNVHTALGVGKDLVKCGIAANLITEMDWWDTEEVDDGISLTATPARHFSGRGLKRGGSLWASFVLQLPGNRIYIGGDSGYDSHFKVIGEKYGPFDLALLETGQYNPDWPYIHMSPEEAVQAALDLDANIMQPVHWGKFALAYHPWNEPATRVVAAAGAQGMKITTPRIGEPVILRDNTPDERWWENLKTFGNLK